jgi:hypothetical protein
MFYVKCQVQKFSSNGLLLFSTPYACLNNLCATATNANFLALPLLTNLSYNSLQYLLNLIADNAAMYSIFLTYGFPIFFIEPLFFTLDPLSKGLGLIPIKLDASFTLLNLSNLYWTIYVANEIQWKVSIA